MAPSASSTSNNQLAIVATATAAVAAGMLLWYRRWNNSSSSSSKNNEVMIPSELLKSPYAKELSLAVKLAKVAGQNMVGYIESKGTCSEDLYNLGILETKSGAADFCTKVDVENENLIIKGIREAFPSHDIIGEETVGTGPIPALRPGHPTWIIDPIDGTTNFSSGIHMTCVSIGFCDRTGRPVVGVIYAPATNEWYLAVKGHGAFRNGIRITQRFTDKTLQTAIICCEFGYSRKQHEIDAMLGAVSKILAKGCRAIRQLGSGCLDLCYVATGRLDIVYAGVVNEGWKPWDYAAGLVICQESGCVMESIHQKAGEEFDLYSNSILCGVSRELVDECRALLLSK